MIRFFLPMFLAATLLATGCATGSGYVTANTNFVYPNSNVTPIAKTEGKSTSLCGLLIITWRGPNQNDMAAAIERALAKTGGDALVDVKVAQGQFLVPGIITLCGVEVEGTAVRMEVGKQELR